MLVREVQRILRLRLMNIIYCSINACVCVCVCLFGRSCAVCTPLPNSEHNIIPNIIYLTCRYIGIWYVTCRYERVECNKMMYTSLFCEPNKSQCIWRW